MNHMQQTCALKTSWAYKLLLAKNYFLYMSAFERQLESTIWSLKVNIAPVFARCTDRRSNALCLSQSHRFACVNIANK